MALVRRYTYYESTVKAEEELASSEFYEVLHKFLCKLLKEIAKDPETEFYDHPTLPEYEIYKSRKRLNSLFIFENQSSFKNETLAYKARAIDDQYYFVSDECEKAKGIRAKFAETNEATANHFEELWVEYISLIKMALQKYSHKGWVIPAFPSCFDAPLRA